MLAKKSPKNVYAHDAANTHQNTLYIVVHDSALHNALTNRPLNKLKGIKIPCHKPENQPYVCSASILHNRYAKRIPKGTILNKHPPSGAAIPYKIEKNNFFIILLFCCQVDSLHLTVH